MRCCIVAVGKAMRGDDAAALLLADTLQAEPVPGVDVIYSSGDVVELLSLFQTCEAVIVLDAYEAGPDDPPVLRLDALEERLPSASCCSSHGLGVAEAVQIAGEMGVMPAKLVVIAIAGYRFDIGSPVSAGMEKRLEAAKALLLNELARLGNVCRNVDSVPFFSGHTGE